jgi:alkanesulfonate monooxygenase SsuD/methylene tetrahydromethanopterin reductase-like flavin-dependent oxidoreductase (luciferase family)
VRVGIGLNSTVPGVERQQVLDWARAADDHGFATLGGIDRLVYPGWDPLVALAAAAAVTERIELVTAILISPYRNTAVLAKEVATLDNLSGGRLTLGVALGAREDDYESAGMAGQQTGRRLDEQLDELRRIWAGEKLGFAGAIGPAPVRDGGVPIIVGGGVQATFNRAARVGEGWIQGAVGPDGFGSAAAGVREAWRSQGRDGEPRLMSLAYFALGDDAQEDAERDLHHYYGWLGEEVAGMIVGGAAIGEEQVQQQIAAFTDAGCDDLILCPTSTDPRQVELLAKAAGL